MRQQQEKFEERQVALKKLEQQFLQQKEEAEKKKIEANIKKKKVELQKMAETVVSYEEISDLTLQITALMIKAGNFPLTFLVVYALLQWWWVMINIGDGAMV